MTASQHLQAPTSDLPAASIGLRWWLIVLTLAAVVFALMAVTFGWLMNMDTEIEMNPHGDPALRADAIGLRIFVWSGVALYILLLAAGVAGGWIAYRQRRNRRSLAVSLAAAVPMLLVAAFFLYFIVRGNS